MDKIMIGRPLPNIPWEDKPEGHQEVLWRYSGNPVIGWNPTPSTARIYNSAVLPYKDGFVGVFRAEHFAQHDLRFLHAAHDVGLHVIGDAGGGEALEYARVGVTRARAGGQGIGNFKLRKNCGSFFAVEFGLC